LVFEEAIAEKGKWGTILGFRFLGVYVLADWFCFRRYRTLILLQEIAGKNEYK
jgi:hypothetical protein